MKALRTAQLEKITLSRRSFVYSSIDTTLTRDVFCPRSVLYCLAVTTAGPHLFRFEMRHFTCPLSGGPRSHRVVWTLPLNPSVSCRCKFGGPPRGFAEQGNKGSCEYIMGTRDQKDEANKGTKAVYGNRENRKSGVWIWGTVELLKRFISVEHKNRHPCEGLSSR